MNRTEQPRIDFSSLGDLDQDDGESMSVPRPSRAVCSRLSHAALASRLMLSEERLFICVSSADEAGQVLDRSILGKFSSNIFSPSTRVLREVVWSVVSQGRLFQLSLSRRSIVLKPVGKQRIQCALLQASDFTRKWWIDTATQDAPLRGKRPSLKPEEG